MADRPDRPTARSAGSAYLVAPDAGEGPGVLVLHAWWGLTPFFRSVCDRLADEGFTALAPDLHGEDRTADTAAEAEALLASTDPNLTARLVLSSAGTLQSLPATPDGPIGVIGFSMGASWAMWLSARAASTVAAAAVFYGSQEVDFAAAEAAYLGHFAERDDYVSDDQLVLLEAELRLLDRDVTFHRYPNTTHWFFEDDRPDAYEPEAAALAWERTMAFLHSHLDR